MRTLTRVIIGCGVVALLAAAPIALLEAADAGVLNGVLIGSIEAKTHRVIRVGRLQLRLLSGAPSIDINNLEVGSPPGTTSEPVARIGVAALHLKLLPLLLGRLELTEVSLTGVDLHLVRLGPSQNNYSFGGAGLSATLSPVRQISLTNGHVSYIDPQRSVTLEGSLEYTDSEQELPLHITGGGVIRGQPYRVSAKGGRLNGRSPHDDYRLQASAEDGLTRLHFVGASQKPFDFRGFDLALNASGPNLADFSYLFNIDAPNSPPFTLTAHVNRSGHVVKMHGIKALIGTSDLAGDLTSDHSGPRRYLIARLVSNSLSASDIAIVAARKPDHASARSQPGRSAPQAKAGGWPTAPFDLTKIRKMDAVVDLTAARVTGYPVALTQMVGRMVLKQGRLEIRPFSVGLAPGALTGQLAIDGQSNNPTLQMSATVHGARISKLRPSTAQSLDGDLDAMLNAQSTGGSMRALAARAGGSFAIRIQNGFIQRSKAAAIGGDPLEAAWLGWVNKGALTPLTCVSAAFRIKDGVAAPSRFLIDTAAGDAVGHGEINLATAQLNVLLEPQGSNRSSVTGPVRITGTLTHPTASVDAKQAMKKAGLGAIVAVAATPFRALSATDAPSAAPSACPLVGAS